MKLPQLTLRDLFWLVLVVAMGCAWGLDHRQAQQLIEQLRDRLELLEFDPTAWDSPYPQSS